MDIIDSLNQSIVESDSPAVTAAVGAAAILVAAAGVGYGTYRIGYFTSKYVRRKYLEWKSRKTVTIITPASSHTAESS